MNNPNSGNAALNELDAYHQILAEEVTDLDCLTNLAADICKAKIAFISFVSKNRQWYKSPYGIDLTKTPFDASFLVPDIRQSDEILIIEDTRKDLRIKSHPIIASHPTITFFAAVPLISPNGISFGTLNIMDDKLKKLNSTQIHTLQVIAGQIVKKLELRKKRYETEIDSSGKASSSNFLINKGKGEELNLRKSEEQRLKLMESVVTKTRDSILITEAEPLDFPGPKILYVNEAFTKMTGYEPEDVIGKSPRIFQGPKSDFTELAKLGEAIRRGEPYEITTINYKKNGDPFWINFTVTPITDDSGETTHLIAIERDVTVQKNRELEKELFSNISQVFKNEDQLKVCLDITVKNLVEFGDFSIAEIWLPDFAGSKLMLMANYALDQIGNDFYDYSPQFTTLSFGEGLPGTIWKNRELEVWDRINEKDSFVRKKASTDSGLNSLIGIPLSHNDEIIGILVIGTGEGKNKFSFHSALFENMESFIGSEIKRKKLENELNQIFSFAPDIISLIDFEGRFRKMNSAGCRLLGYEEDEINQMTFEILVHQDDLHISFNAWEVLKEGKKLFNFENRYITKSGQVIWLSWTCNSVEEEGLVYAVAKDVTKLKKLQVLLDDSSKLAKVGSWEIDLLKDEDNVFWSDVTKEIREAEPDFEPTLSKGISGFVEGYDQDTIRQRIKDCIENGIEWDEELKIITEKGNLKWIRTIGKPVFENGKCIRVNGSFQDIHQLKMTEMNLKESLHSLESYKFALDQSAIITITDDKGIIISVNDNFCEISKYSREETIGKTHRLINSGYHSKDFFSNLWESISSGNVWRGEIRNRAKDSSTYWVDTTIVPFIGADNKPYQYLAIRFDITARKFAEEKVLAMLKEKDSILESIDDGFFTVDKDWIITYWNTRAEKMIQKNSAEIIGKNFWEVFPESIGNEFYDKGIWAMENGEAVQFEDYSPRINRWVETSVYPSENGLSVYFKDISIRKLTAEQIRLSNERFEKVTEATNDAIWDWDIESGTFYQGKGFEKLFGYKVGNVLKAVDIFPDKSHPDDIAGILSSLNSAIEDFKIKNWTHEYRIINDKSGIRSVIAKGMIIRNLDGKAIRMVGAITDITHQKEYEESLKNLNNELELKAKKLEFSNSELEQFAFIASHDLQEPLRMVTSFMSQLERKYGNLLDAKAHSYIKFATDGATRMKGIIRDLLDYSRAGKVENEKEEIDLNSTLKDYVLLRKKLLTDNGGSILFQSLPLVEAYKAPLEQTIYNLLDNALKYSKPTTPPVVQINIKDDGDYWLFSIEDNGLGIKEEYFDQIFVIFQRLHNRDEYSGTGMGLAIVKKNVESWNGKIWLDSIKGSGTTFYFTLPK